jgi:Uma2 family endonuclease
MSTAEKLLTAEEFFHLPEPIEGGKMELVDGKVVTMSPVGLQHGEVAAEICEALRAFVRPRRLGTVTQETGFRLRRNPDLVRAPDVSFLRAERTPPRGSRASFVEGYPDLAVEVLSPDDRMADVLRKVAEYLDAGAPRVWVADPAAASVAVYRAGGMRTLGTGETLTSDEAGFEAEGFALPVHAIFAS